MLLGKDYAKSFKLLDPIMLPEQCFLFLVAAGFTNKTVSLSLTADSVDSGFD